MMQVLQYLLVICISLVPLSVNAKLPKVLENLNATVLIVAENKKRDPLDFLVEPTKDSEKKKAPTGMGTGVIISKSEGIIITNHHVIDRSSKIIVYVYSKDDTTKYNAKIIGVDEITDIAVLKITDFPLPDNITEVTWSNGPEIGHDVYTIGHPQGMAWTVAKGIVGHTERYPASPWQTMIQHDSLIMPGNSGGGLFDESGHLVGINTLLLESRDKTNTQAWSLSVSIDDVRWSFSRIMKWGSPRRPAMNVALEYNEDTKELSVIPNKGSNAIKSCMKEESILLKVNNKDASTYPKLFEILKNKLDGDQVTMETKLDNKVYTCTFNLENWTVLSEKSKTD